MASAQPVVLGTDDPCAPAPALARAAEPEPTPNDSMLSLAYYHLRKQRAALEREAVRFNATQDPESVHEMRIATRKLRAGLKTFRSLLPDPERAALNAELRWLTSELGKLRDLDVYHEDCDNHLSLLPEGDRQQAQAHIDGLMVARAEARSDAELALTSARYVKLTTRLRVFFDDAPSAAASRRWGDFRICDGVDAYVKAGLRRVQKKARSIGAVPEADALHDLRIEVKRYRYLVEFFAPLYPEPLERPLKAARRLQGLLGRHQDACLAEDRLRAYAGSANAASHRPAEFLALGRVLDGCAGTAAEIRARFAKASQRFAKAEPRFPIAS